MKKPIIIALAGSNGAGKSTFYEAHLRHLGLRFVNADVLAKELRLEALSAATTAEIIRQLWVSSQESFVFETVLSDPEGAKIASLVQAQNQGYHVVLIFIALIHVDLSFERVSMRVSQGGHDVPDDRLENRFPRTLLNLRRGINQLHEVKIYDNSDLSRPYQFLASYRDGQLIEGQTPNWLNS